MGYYQDFIKIVEGLRTQIKANVPELNNITFSYALPGILSSNNEPDIANVERVHLSTKTEDFNFPECYILPAEDSILKAAQHTQYHTQRFEIFVFDEGTNPEETFNRVHKLAGAIYDSIYKDITLGKTCGEAFVEEVAKIEMFTQNQKSIHRSILKLSAKYMRRGGN